MRERKGSHVRIQILTIFHPKIILHFKYKDQKRSLGQRMHVTTSVGERIARMGCVPATANEWATAYEA